MPNAKVYESSKWIGNDRTCIYSCSINKRLNPEEHCHDFYEIIYLFSGDGTHRVNGTLNHMGPGDAVILRPYDTHLFVEQSEQIELYSISVLPETITHLFESYRINDDLRQCRTALQLHMGNEPTSAILKLFRKLSFLSSEEEKEAIIRVILGETIHCHILQKMDKDRGWLQNILLQMCREENLVEGVPAMMRISKLSHAQLCRTMQKKGLQPPKVYIKELRLSTAYEFIRNTSLPYEEIALRVGYSSVSHFYTAFKERYGLTPSVLRKAEENCLL